MRLSKMSSRAQAGRGDMDLRSRGASDPGIAGSDVGAIRSVSRAVARAGVSRAGVRLHRAGGHAAIGALSSRLAARGRLPGGGYPAQERLLRRLRRCQRRAYGAEWFCPRMITQQLPYVVFVNLMLMNVAEILA